MWRRRSGYYRTLPTRYRSWLKGGKDGFTQGILDVWNQLDSFPFLHKTFKHPWIAGTFCIHLVMHRSNLNIKQAGGIKLNKVGNTCSVPVSCYWTLVDTMKTQLSYTEAPNFNCGVKPVDDCVKDIINDHPSSVYLPTRTQTTHWRYIRIIELCINDIALITMLERSWAEGGRVRTCTCIISIAWFCISLHLTRWGWW